MDQTAQDARLIEIKRIAIKREEQLKPKIAGLTAKPKIVSILINDDPTSIPTVYIKKAQELGIDFQYMRFSESELFENVALTILKLNQDPNILGIRVHLPVAEKFLGERSIDDLLQRIDPKKDVDGQSGKGKFLPSIDRAIGTILDEQRSADRGKFTVILGTDKIVANAMRKRGALVASVSGEADNIAQVTERADIIIVTPGNENILKSEMVKQGVIVINMSEIGDISVLSLMENLVDAALQ